MAVTPSQLIAPAFIPNAATTVYTSTAAKTRIDYMSFANQSASNVTLTVRLGAVASSPIILAQTVLPGETYLCPEVIGALLVSGEIIRYECSAAGALFGSANGVQFT